MHNKIELHTNIAKNAYNDTTTEKTGQQTQSESEFDNSRNSNGKRKLASSSADHYGRKSSAEMAQKDRFDKIWDAMRSKKFAEALNILENFSRADKGYKWFLTHAQCLVRLGRYPEALSSILSLQEVDDTSLFVLADCYGKNKQFDEAVSTYRRISNAGNDNMKVSLGIAINLHMGGRVDEAIKAFQNILKHELSPDITKNVLQGLARCYQDQHQYSLAIQTYKEIPLKDYDIKIRLNLGRCYEANGDYDLAMSTVEKIKGWRENTMASSIMAPCLLATGKSERACFAYKKVLEQDKQNKTAIMGLAKCHENLNRHVDALDTYKTYLKWEQDNEICYKIGLCYLKNNKHSLAIESFHKITDWKKQPGVILSLATCHEHKGDHRLALSTYELIENWQLDQNVLLSMARCWEALGEYDVAIECLECDPNAQSSPEMLKSLARLFQLKQYYTTATMLLNRIDGNDKELKLGLRYQKINQNDRAIETYQNMINWDTKDWTSNRDATSALSRCYMSMQRYDLALEMLLTIPGWMTNESVLLDIANLNQHVADCDGQKAAEYQKLYMQTFHGQRPLINKIQMLTNNQIVKGRWDIDVDAKPDLQDIKIHDMDVNYSKLFTVQLAVDAISEISNEYYIAGKTVHNIIDQVPLNPNQDVDIVTMAVDSSIINQMGFEVCKTKSNLYTTKINNVFVNMYAQENKKFYPDFTITSLYIDKNKKLFDPTGKGLQDYNTRTLRTSRPAMICCEEDPAMVLRAISYILSGFTPDENLNDAMTHWQPDFNANNEHLKIVARKYLATLNEGKFFKELLKYDLLKKMFHINYSTEEEGLFLLKMLVAKPQQKNAILAHETQCHQKRGMVEYEAKNYVQAINIFTTALNLSPNDTESLFWRGKSYFAQQNYDAAIHDFSALLALTEDAAVYNQRGVAYMLSHKQQPAANDFTRIRSAVNDFKHAANLKPDVKNYKDNLDLAEDKLNKTHFVTGKCGFFVSKALSSSDLGLGQENMKKDSGP